MRSQETQESWYGQDHDYRAESPHLSHPQLNRRMVGLVRAAIADVADRGLPMRVLEIGAGHGQFVEVSLAAGAEVVATEMSRPSIAALEDRFRRNPKFSARFAADDTLSCVGDEQFSVLLFASVLHHIPDYISAITTALDHLVPGGALVTLADPLWYQRLSRIDHMSSRGAYLLWRSTRGDYVAGARTRLRRVRGVLDPSEPRDMVEYHVVRRGVDELAVHSLLTRMFEDVELIRYWSTQGAMMQRAGHAARRVNSFAFTARGRLP